MKGKPRRVRVGALIHREAFDANPKSLDGLHSAAGTNRLKLQRL